MRSWLLIAPEFRFRMKGKGILEGSVMTSGKLGRLDPVTRTEIEDSNFTIRMCLAGQHLG